MLLTPPFWDANGLTPMPIVYRKCWENRKCFCITRSTDAWLLPINSGVLARRARLQPQNSGELISFTETVKRLICMLAGICGGNRVTELEIRQSPKHHVHDAWCRYVLHKHLHYTNASSTHVLSGVTTNVFRTQPINRSKWEHPDISNRALIF